MILLQITKLNATLSIVAMLLGAAILGFLLAYLIIWPRYKSIRERYQELSRNYDSLKDDHVRLNHEHTKLKSQHDALKSENIEVTAKLTSCVQRRDALEKEVTHLNEIKHKYNVLRPQFASSQQKAEALETEVSDQKADIHALEGALKDSTRKTGDLGQEIMMLMPFRTKSEELEAENAALKELLKSHGISSERELGPEEESEEKEPEGDEAEKVLSRIGANASLLNFDRIGTASEGKPDDLKIIKGIGPFSEKKLNALGIMTYKQIASFTEEDEDQVNEAIEFFPGRVKRDRWVEQAKRLMGLGKEDLALERVKRKAEGKVDLNRLGIASTEIKDDLKIISGIGPFIEKKLNSIGIFTFAQISRFTPEDEDIVNEVIEFFPGRIKRDNWTGQARSLAEKNEDDEQNHS